MLDEDSISLIEDEYCVEKELDKEMSFDEVSMGKTAGFSSPQEARRNAEIPIKEQIPFFCMMASRYPKYILIYGVVVAGVLYNCIDSNFIPPNGMLFTFFYKQLHWIPQRAEPEPIPHTPYLHWILSVAKLPQG